MAESSINLEDLATRFGCELRGDPTLMITEVAGLDKAKKNSITFLANDKYKALLKETNAGAIILRPKDLEDCQSSALITDDPYLIFARIASYFEKSRNFEEGCHPLAVVEDSAKVPSSCSIQPGAYIGKGAELGEFVFVGSNSVVSANCTIDSNSWLDPGVMILNESSIGKRAIIHSGAVIGGDGFGFSEDEDQNWIKVPQTGSVIIGDDVEIGANTTIDRGTMSNTEIHNGVKLDNLIMIGHNVIVGEHTAIVANTAIAGSTVIGKHCKISGQVGITGHIEIADGTTITARTSVMKSIKKAGVYSSSLFPHQEATLWQKNVAIFRNLPSLKSLISKIKIEDEDGTDS